MYLSTGLIDPVVTSIELAELATLKEAFDQALAILEAFDKALAILHRT